MNQPAVWINTCPFREDKLPLLEGYAGEFGDALGYEILAMFDLPAFEDGLRRCVPFLKGKAIAFHGPVFEAEHSAPKGTIEYERTMYHVRKTLEFAALLGASHFTMHLNNRSFLPDEKDGMLKTALENYEELRKLFEPVGCSIYIENTGLGSEGNMLLDQDEFTDLSRKEGFKVLMDVGHAHANGWDLERLIEDLAPQIKAYHLHNNDGKRDLHGSLREGTLDMDGVLRKIYTCTPGAKRIIEYTRPQQEAFLRRDINYLLERDSSLCEK